LPDPVGIGASDAARRGLGHGGSRAGRDNSGFRAGQFGQPFSGGGLQLVQVHEVVRGCFRRAADLRQFQTTAQVSIGAARIDDRADPKLGVWIADRLADTRRHGIGKTAGGHGCEQRRSGQQFEEGAAAGTVWKGSNG